MTPLERRLSRATQSSDGGDDLATAAIARRVTSLLSPDEGGGDRPSLLPPPLPAAISEAALLARHHGDGVPIGLVDRPERAGNEAYWWQPGPDGSILAAGSPRSGMTALIDLVITGVAARLSADDVHVYAIESLPQRRRALSALPHTGSVVTPGEPTLVVQLVQGLHRLLDERLATRDREDRSHLVLLIGDVGRMRRALPADRVASVMDQLADLAAAGSAVGINVIAITTRLDDLGPLTSLTGDRLVAAMSDPDDRTRMGAPAIGPADRHVRRCWSIDAERRVQLATPAESIEREVARLQPEPAHQRPPQVIVGQDAR